MDGREHDGTLTAAGRRFEDADVKAGTLIDATLIEADVKRPPKDEGEVRLNKEAILG